MGQVQKVQQIINDNVNEISFRKLNNDNVNDGKRRNSAEKANYVENKARYIMRKLHATMESWKFYCKCALHLAESFIDDALEEALAPGVRNPAAYFGRICQTALQRLGY